MATGVLVSTDRPNMNRRYALTHVKTSCYPCAGQWLIFLVLRPCEHQTRHLLLGQLDLPPAKGSEVDVCNLVRLRWFAVHDCGGYVCGFGYV